MVSREEQERMGLLRQQPNRMIVLPSQREVHLQQFQPHSVSLDVTHPATQHVEVRTSAVERAKGYQLMITPISLVLAVLAVLVSLAFDNDFFTFWSLLLFWLTFCAVYVIGWVLTAAGTPEFVSWYGAKRQWDIVEREQEERRDHYKWQSGRIEKPGMIPLVTLGVEFPAKVLFVAGLLGVGLGLAYLLGW